MANPNDDTALPVQQPAQFQVQPQLQQPPPVMLLSPWDGNLELSTKTGNKSLWDEGIKSLKNKFSGQGGPGAVSGGYFKPGPEMQVARRHPNY